MPIYKATLLFVYQKVPACGFSESIEFEQGDDVLALGLVAALPAFRKQWLSEDWKIVGFRLGKQTIVEVSGKCREKFIPIQVGACPGAPIGMLGSAETPMSAVLFRISFADKTKHPRQYQARGIPNTWWAGGLLAIPPGDVTKFQTWFNIMKTAHAGAQFWNAKRAPACTPNFKRWDSFCLQRISSRRIGRPFGLIRGRRAKRKILP